MSQYDVLVVGAGPAGSSAALEAAKAGCRVLMVEKRKEIGLPVQCAEYIPKMLLAESGVSTDVISQKIESMITHLPDGEIVETSSPGYILNRDAFDKALASNAKEKGAEIMTETLCVSKAGDEVYLRQGDKDIIVSPKVIVGADGPNSVVGKWIGSINTEFVSGLQCTLPLTAPQDFTEIFFDSKFIGGYGWLFPKRDVANVGIGIKSGSPNGTGRQLRALLDDFIKELEGQGKVKNSPVSLTAGPIPVGGPLNTVKENILLVGDAAGHTDAITGGGITQAVMCGKMAGKAAARAIDEDDLGRLKAYEKEWQMIYGQTLQNALEKRRILESRWDELDTVIKKCWVAFREYYHD